MDDPLARPEAVAEAVEAVDEDEPAKVESGQSSEDSSADSGESSGSSSDEGSSESGSTTDSGQALDDGAQRAEQPDGLRSDTDQDNQSIDESFKTVNTTLKPDDNTANPELNVTPVHAQQMPPPAAPSGALEAQLPVASVGGLSGADGPDQSPVPVTPAKQVEWGDLLHVIEAPAKVSNVTDGVFLTPKGPVNPQFSPGELFSPPRSVPVAGVLIRQVASVGADLASKLQPQAATFESPDGRTRDSKKSKVKRSKHRKDRAVKKVEDDVRQLQREIDEIRVLKAKIKLEAKKRRMSLDKKQKRAKRSKPQSSGGAESSGSSSPEPPSTSNRISRIPNGRKYQRIAMSRSKQLGVIVLNDDRAALVSGAAKLVGQAEFKILPVHAYQLFHQVPGTGLPHIRKLVRDLQVRYAPFIKATAQLHLGLSMEYRQSRNRLVVPDDSSPFTSIWTAENDLTRASDKPDTEVGQLELAQPSRSGTAAAASSSGAPAAGLRAPSAAASATLVKISEEAVVGEGGPQVAQVEVTPKIKPAKKKKKDGKEAKSGKVKQEVISYLCFLDLRSP